MSNCLNISETGAMKFWVQLNKNWNGIVIENKRTLRIKIFFLCNFNLCNCNMQKTGAMVQ